MKRTFIYCFLVWITSVIIGPFIYALITPFYEQYIPGTPMFNLWPSLFKYGAIFSLPSLFLSMIFVFMFRKHNLDVITKKVIFSILGVALTALPLYLLDGGPQARHYTISYGLVVVAGIWIYRFDYGLE